MKKAENRLFTGKSGRAVKGMIFAVAILLMGSALCLIRPVQVLAGEYSGDDVKTSDFGRDEEVHITGNTILTINASVTINKIEIDSGIANHYTLSIKGLPGKTLTVNNKINHCSPTGNVTDDCADLEVKSGNIICHGIRICDLKISGGNVNILGFDSTDPVGINSRGKIEISGGIVNAWDKKFNKGIVGENITISGGTVNAEGKLYGIYAAGDNAVITIKGNNTVVRAKTIGDSRFAAVTVFAGTLDPITIFPPLKIIKPAGGGICKIDNTGITYIGTENNSYKRAYDVLISSGAVNDDEKASGRTYRTDDDDDDEQETTKPAEINRNAPVMLNMTVTGFPYGTFLAKEEQGAAAKAAFLGAHPAGYKSAFTFNIITNGKAPDTSLKTGSFTMIIPEEFRKAGRTFAIICLDKNGKAVTLYDTDKDPDTITVNVNFEGYAFELIYKD